MQNLILIILAGFILITGCSNEGSASNEIKFGETKLIDNVEVTFQKIEDSRCCTFCVCVWEGQVEVGLELIFSNQSFSSALISRDGHPELASDTMQNRIVRLLNVEPDRDLRLRVDKDYIITLEID